MGVKFDAPVDTSQYKPLSNGKTDRLTDADYELPWTDPADVKRVAKSPEAHPEAAADAEKYERLLNGLIEDRGLAPREAAGLLLEASRAETRRSHDVHYRAEVMLILSAASGRLNDPELAELEESALSRPAEAENPDQTPAEAARELAEEADRSLLPLESVDLADAGTGPGWLPDHQPLPGVLVSGWGSLLHGRGGSGKSAFAAALALALAAAERSPDAPRLLLGCDLQGRPAGGGRYEAQAHRVLYATLEDSVSVTAGRIAAAAHRYGVAIPDGAIRFADYPALLATGAETGLARLAAIDEAARRAGATAVIVDNLRLLDPEAERGSDSATRLMAAANSRARHGGYATLLIHHDRKTPDASGGAAVGGAEMAAGSAALANAARAAAQVTRRGDTVTVGGAEGKANYSPEAQQLRFQLDGYASEATGHYGTVTLKPLAPVDPMSVFGGVEQAREAYEDLIAAAPELRRFFDTANGWAGYVLADSLGLDVGASGARNRTAEQSANRSAVQAALDEWVRGGALQPLDEEIIERDRTRQKKPCYAAGKRGFNE